MKSQPLEPSTAKNRSSKKIATQMPTKGKKVGIFIRGKPRLVIVGEAPGPRGASITGFPFWGDFSGTQIYELLYQLGLMDEARFKPPQGPDYPGTPPNGNYAITNAFDQMPWNAGTGAFRAPTQTEIRSQSERLAREIKESGAQVVLAVGASAARALDYALGTDLLPSRAGLTEAIERSVKSGGVRYGDVHLFLTFHPSYGQWKKPGTGDLHKKVIKAIEKYLKKSVSQ